MATMSASTMSQATTASATSTRERMALAPWLEKVLDDKGERVLGFALRLSGISFLPGDGQHKPVYSGMLEADFIDPVTGAVPMFVNSKGETVQGKCPVRVMGLDGLSAHNAFGVVKDMHLLMGVKPEADVAVYRKEDGSVAFLVLRVGDITGAFRWVEPPLPEIDAHDFGGKPKK